MLTDIQTSFTRKLISKFAIKLLLNTQPHLKCVAALPSKICVQKIVTIKDGVQQTATQKVI